MNDQLGKLMKQAQKMQADMMEEQEKLNSMVFKGSAGGGMAEVVVNGKMEITDIKIMPEAVDPEDVEMLEDVILAAIQEAQKKASQEKESSMSALTGGMKLPGLM
ncbi:MAG: YbaB/EbfC family nucleoid-associated protein [bacterium]|nr:YbaB/EbfC family nucleoid-associated protein [bacterium]